MFKKWNCWYLILFILLGMSVNGGFASLKGDERSTDVLLLEKALDQLKVGWAKILPCGEVNGDEDYRRRHRQCQIGELDLENLPRFSAVGGWDQGATQLKAQEIAVVVHRLIHKACFDKAYFTEVLEDLVRLQDSPAFVSWAVNPMNTIALLLKIKASGPKLVEEARKKGKTIELNFPLPSDANPKQKASVYVKPDGEVIIGYGAVLVGRGSNKNVYSRLATTLTEKGRLHSALAKVEWDTSAMEIAKEEWVYEKLRTFQEKLPKGQKLPGIAEADILHLLNGKTAVVQERLFGDFSENLDLLQQDEVFRRKTLTESARGLEVIHDAGLVHGDFKWKNVLKDQNGLPKITDFGLSYDPLLKVNNSSTPRYEPPEMIRLRFDGGHMGSVKTRQRAPFQARDTYAFGLASLEAFGLDSFLPGFYCIHLLQDSKHTADTATFASSKTAYFDTTESYADCMERASTDLWDFWRHRAEVECPSHAARPCYPEIFARSLDPDPERRISMKEVREALEKGTQVSGPSHKQSVPPPPNLAATAMPGKDAEAVLHPAWSRRSVSMKTGLAKIFKADGTAPAGVYLVKRKNARDSVRLECDGLTRHFMGGNFYYICQIGKIQKFILEDETMDPTNPDILDQLVSIQRVFKK